MITGFRITVTTTVSGITITIEPLWVAGGGWPPPPATHTEVPTLFAAGCEPPSRLRALPTSR